MKTYLEPEDVQLMEGAATCLRDRLLIQLLFRLGCRVSELLAIKVSDINFTDGMKVCGLKLRDCPDRSHFKLLLPMTQKPPELIIFLWIGRWHNQRVVSGSHQLLYDQCQAD
jgi:integrase